MAKAQIARQGQVDWKRFVFTDGVAAPPFPTLRSLHLRMAGLQPSAASWPIRFVNRIVGGIQVAETPNPRLVARWEAVERIGGRMDRRAPKCVPAQRRWRKALEYAGKTPVTQQEPSEGRSLRRQEGTVEHA
jgi:hypothetical protein